MEVEPRRFNVFAQWGDRLDVTLSTHMDTVPPFSPRAKTTNSSGAAAPATPRASSLHDHAAERCSPPAAQFRPAVRGRRRAQQRRRLSRRQHPRGSRYIINGEPTENKLALGSKGALRYEVVARGKMAHSAYPELGDSAIDKLLDALPPSAHSAAGGSAARASTLNIGTIPAAARPT
jgi:acetylornithine deacetylase